MGLSRRRSYAPGAISDVYFSNDENGPAKASTGIMKKKRASYGGRPALIDYTNAAPVVPDVLGMKKSKVEVPSSSSSSSSSSSRRKRVSFGGIAVREFEKGNMNNILDIGSADLPEDDSLSLSLSEQENNTNTESTDVIEEDGMGAFLSEDDHEAAKNISLSLSPSQDKARLSLGSILEGSSPISEDGVKPSFDEVSMDFTKGYGAILEQVTEEIAAEQAALSLSLSVSNEEKEETVEEDPSSPSPELEEVTMEITANVGKILSSDSTAFNEADKEQEEEGEEEEKEGEEINNTVDETVEESAQFSSSPSPSSNVPNMEEMTMDFTGNFGSIIQQTIPEEDEEEEAEEEEEEEQQGVERENEKSLSASLSLSHSNSAVETEPVLDHITMEMTEGHGGVVEAAITTNMDEVSMEFTKNHGTIEEEEEGEERERERENASNSLPLPSSSSSSVTRNLDEVSMEITNNYGNILSSLSPEEEHNQHNEAPQAPSSAVTRDLAEVSMEFTQNFGAILESTEMPQVEQEHITASSSSSLSPSLTQELAADSNNNLSSDNTTSDLPTMDKLGDLTRDMAAIYDKILKGEGKGEESDERDEENMTVDVTMPDVTSDFTSNYTSSSSSSSRSYENDMEEEGENEQAAQLSFRDFLFLSDIDLDSLSGKNRRRSSMVGSSRISLANSLEMEWPPKELADVLRASSINSISLSNTVDALSKLEDILSSQVEDTAKMEEWINEHNPAVFAELQQDTPEADEKKKKMRQLVKVLSLQSQMTWAEWRVKLEEGTYERLLENATSFNNDLNTLEKFSTRIRNLRLQVEERNSPAVLALKNAITEQSDVIAMSQTEVNTWSERLSDIEIDTKKKEEEKSHLEASIAEAEAKNDLLLSTQKVAHSTQDAYGIAKACCGLYPTHFHESGIEITMLAQYQVLLSLSQNPDVNITAPTGFRTTLLSASQTHIQKVVSSFSSSFDPMSGKTKGAIQTLLTELSYILGRIESAATELYEAESSFSMIAATDDDCFAFRLSSPSAQIRIEFAIDCGYPYAYLPCDVTVQSGSSTVAQVKKAMNSFKGFGRINKALAHIQNNLC